MFGHPLDDLNGLLEAYAEEEEALKAVHQSVESVLTVLRNKDDQPHKGSIEIVLEDTLPVTFVFHFQNVLEFQRLAKG